MSKNNKRNIRNKKSEVPVKADSTGTESDKMFPGKLSRNQYLAVLSFLILIIAFAVYGNSIQNEFTNWDDQMVTENLGIRSLTFDSVADMFRVHRGATYQPVRMLSYAIDYHFWELNPAGYHIHNIFLHAFAGVFLFITLVTILPRILPESVLRFNERSNGLPANLKIKDMPVVWLIAFLTSVIFVVHPVNVESVTWIAGRKYTLLSFFSFLSFYFFAISSRNEKYHMGYSAISIILCVLAVMSSPFGIVLPALFFLFDYCRDAHLNPFAVIRKRWVYYLPYFVFLSFFAVVLVYALVAGASGGADKEHVMGRKYYTFLTMIRVLFDYARNLIFPVWLNCRYVDRVSFSVFELKVVISFVTIFLTAYFASLELKKGSKWLLFCFGWFLISWLPTSNIIPISTKMADRYIYMASVGMFLLYSTMICRLLHKINNRKLLHVFTVIVLIHIAGLSALTIQRNRVWKNSLTLWQDSLEKEYDSPLAHGSLGVALHDKGDVELAIFHFREALRFDPENFNSYKNLGSLLQLQGKPEEAISYYKKALALRPESHVVYNYIGQVLEDMGDYDESEKHYRRALELFPNYFDALNNLGNILIKKEKYDEAIAAYKRALRLNNDEKSEHNIGFAYQQKGELDNAVLHYQRALGINDENSQIHNSMARALADKGDFAGALKHLEKAAALSPEDPDVLFNLANVFYLRNNYEEAIHYFEKVLLITPKDTEIHKKLGICYGKLGNRDKAYFHLNEAVKSLPASKTNTSARDEIAFHYEVASQMAKLGRYDEAVKHFDIAASLSPENYMLYYKAATALHVSGYIDGAIKYYTQSLRLNPDNPGAENNLGIAYSVKGDTGKAVQHFSKAVEMQPENYEAQNNLANALKKSGKREKALSHYKKAVAINPVYIDGYYNLGIFYFERKDYQTSRKYFEEIIRLNPDHENSQKKLEILDKLM